MPNLKKLILDAIYIKYPNTKDLISLDDVWEMRRVRSSDPTYEVKKGNMLIRAIIPVSMEISIVIKTI